MTPVRKTRVELSPCPPASPGPGGPPVLALGRWEALCTGLRLRPPGGSAPPCPRAGCPAGTHLTQAGAGGPRPQVRRLTGEPADSELTNSATRPGAPPGSRPPTPALPCRAPWPHLAVGWPEAVSQPAQAAQVPLETGQFSPRRVVCLAQGLAGSRLLLPESRPQRQQQVTGQQLDHLWSEPRGRRQVTGLLRGQRSPRGSGGSPAPHSVVPRGVEGPRGAAAWKTRHREQESGSRVSSGSRHLVLSVAAGGEGRPGQGLACVSGTHVAGAGMKPCGLTGRHRFLPHHRSPLRVAWPLKPPEGAMALPP